jgi:hypothetical protein
MAKQNTIPGKLKLWIDAKKRHRLSQVHIQMARELGMNPRKFGKLDNHKQEPWKAPLPVFIEGLYYKRFGKARPDFIKSFKEIARDDNKKKEERKKRKEEKKRLGQAAYAETSSDQGMRRP